MPGRAAKAASAATVASMATIAQPQPTAPYRTPHPDAGCSWPASPKANIAPLSSALSLGPIDTTAVPVPNKHIAVCPAGPAPQQKPDTPPPSPEGENNQPPPSLLWPPDKYARLKSGHLSLYMLAAADVAAAFDYVSRQPLPEPSQVFPWLHGLHPNNQIQQTFFTSRRRALRNTPCCLRGIALVKADGDVAVSRLKSAIPPHEFLVPGDAAEFIDVDPREGFSVRNFQIQAAKSAMMSDIIVYGDDDEAVRRLGWDIAAAQQRWRERHELQGLLIPQYSTFLCLSSFREFEEHYPHLVSIDSLGRLTGKIVDFFTQERKEMHTMTRASEISPNVWLGPTPDFAHGHECDYDILIECNDLARPSADALVALADGVCNKPPPFEVEFPSSGSIPLMMWSETDMAGILETCRWIYHLSHGTRPSSTTDGDGDGQMMETSEAIKEVKTRPRKILIHCSDGYTESTLLAIAYYSYSTAQPIPDAWLNLHMNRGRNFFAYPTDVSLLSQLGPRLLQESPVCVEKMRSEIHGLVKKQPKWFSALDGSLPSRILDYMYLGNLTHANNPGLLRALGIAQLLSVGETATWKEDEVEEWGADRVCFVQGVQDNGIDALTDEFDRCLEFIDRGRKNGTATLVHCRVGVSRSATICIAEVMRSLGLSFPRAYCFVRARRLNVIIQPHLRFAYELLKWEEVLQQRWSSQSHNHDDAAMGCIRRELEWGEIAREIALMNRPYVR